MYYGMTKSEDEQLDKFAQAIIDEKDFKIAKVLARHLINIGVEHQNIQIKNLLNIE